MKKVLVLLFIVTLQTLACAGENATLSDFAQRYKQASTPTERRQICIEAIDQKIIVGGCSVKIIDQIFGTNFSNHFPKNGPEIETATVDFEPQTGPSFDKRGWAIQKASVGWYFAFKYDSKGAVWYYYISNYHDK